MFENKYICIYNFMEFTMIFTMSKDNPPPPPPPPPQSTMYASINIRLNETYELYKNSSS